MSSTPCGRGHSPVKLAGRGMTCESPSWVKTLSEAGCSRHRMASGPVFWKKHQAALITGAATASCLRSTPPEVHTTLHKR